MLVLKDRESRDHLGEDKYMTRKAELTQEKLRSLLGYDPLTGLFSRRSEDCSVIRPKPNAGGYLRIFVDGKLHYAHRLAWLYVNGSFPPSQIDHVNLDKSDNRIANLRLATQQENSQNFPKTKRNTSGIPGVHWCKRDGKWCARIRIGNGLRLTIGYYDELSDAAVAVADAKARYHKFNPVVPIPKT